MSEPPSWRLVASDDDWATVEALERRWIEELGGTSNPKDEAWLCGPDDGYATFLEGTPWRLMRVWIRPELRRQGLLAAQWPVFLGRYGAAFKVSQPSPAMVAFMEKVGHPTGANTGARRGPPARNRL
jgi:hypothetical protein